MMESPDHNITLQLNYVKKSNETITYESKELAKAKDTQTLNNDRMTSSGGSFLEDTTPSDSGVQLLDSESSELNESLMSNSGFDFDNVPAVDTNRLINQINDDKELPADLLTKSDIANSNICETQLVETSQIPDELISSTHSTFDAENIVYRRRAKKSKSHSTAPKKRVSFHEDILKNTKTDNIHIEHGFITYKTYPKKTPQIGRYSWCSEGDTEDFNENNHHVYRNACSDVLDYGKTDIYEHPTPNYVHYDNSGVFEYGPSTTNKEFYKCNCSDSNSSLDSGSSQSDENNAKENYAQAKSNSCDCIGSNNQNNNNLIITENCYYSEPSIEILDQKELCNRKPKSVWSKDKKPKSSCLKKSKRHTDILVECDLNSKVKKFNIHPLSDMNHLIDNSKMIFGSLKNIFSIPLPERGVPEGSEDLQSVCECIPPENEQKTRPFLSKSLDGVVKDISGNNTSKNYVHNVDEQLRRKNDSDLFAPTRQNSRDFVFINDDSSEIQNNNDESIVQIKTNEIPDPNPINYRNKFIINCESTVFEHTGVSYCYENEGKKVENDVANAEKTSSAAPKVTSSFSAPLKQKLSNIFKNLTESSTSNSNVLNSQTEKSKVMDEPKINVMDLSFTSSCSDKDSIVSDMTTTTNTTTTTDQLSGNIINKHVIGTMNSPRSNKNRHLASPLRKKPITTRYDRSRMSPDLFNNAAAALSKSSFLSEEFDDILTITTTTSDTDKNDSDLVILDYPAIDQNDLQYQTECSNNYLKPPPTKTSLINRFLRNVTQKKIIDASIKKNSVFLSKLKTEKKLFGNLYFKNAKVENTDNLLADFNAEIAMEIEMLRSPETKKGLIIRDRFEIGVGEVSIDIFNGNFLHILRSDDEILMKSFKLYTGYSREGFMTPVLVFLTDKTLYVTDLVRNRLCNKFVLPYSDLDVILMGPYGNTVLLSNGSRDMQQVLLAGGPYPADGLVSSLELCARRGGSTLPAVGQLTLDHLTPLQAFVLDNSSISRNDPWMYYAVVNVPSGSLNRIPEPMGPHIKGPLMHRSMKMIGSFETWQPGYFLLKAGVLYMFHDSLQKIPTWAVALHECQGARRAMTAGRPHCFELLLKSEILQLAAPDEYVASEWLQSLVQAASGLFEMQEKHLTLGCTLIMTPNHLLTLREDFGAPLRRINLSPSKENVDPNVPRNLSNASLLDTSSEVSSITSNVSTPTKSYERRNNSNLSTPTKSKSMQSSYINEKSYTTMSSLYGKNSGVEILTCAALNEIVTLKIPADQDNWWCILEFSCQEVRENSDDLVIFFATNSELQRFLSMLETIWYSKNDDPFPISVISEVDTIAEHCQKLFTELNTSWEPLLSAALGFPQ